MNVIHYQSEYTTIHLGDALNILPTIPDASVDAIISDPPYPEISRSYGRLTEWEWAVLMLEVCRQAQRILKPTGSAVFILQPNSRKVGSMRGWLWEFMAWVCREWNMVQDVWWWNTSALTTGLCTPRERGLLRASLKACVWCGPNDCYRDQDNALWLESQGNKYRRSIAKRFSRDESPSGQGSSNTARYTSIERGGVTPFNVLPIPRGGGDTNDVGKHSASTPLPLADWWTRYICPPKSTILDPFVGAGTMGVAALLHGHKFIGIDKEAMYLDISQKRCQEVEQQRDGEMHLRPRRPVERQTVKGQMELWEG